jgi:hypothetical protein
MILVFLIYPIIWKMKRTPISLNYMADGSAELDSISFLEPIQGSDMVTHMN